MPKCLFFLNFGTIKVTFNCILLKVISAGQICTTSNDKGKELKRDLRKTPKLSYQALHPGNNKQNVQLALALFHDTAIAAAKSNYQNKEDVSGFLNVTKTWWTILNKDALKTLLAMS